MSKLSKWAKKQERKISHAIPHQHSADRRAANQAVSEQIDLYQKEKAQIEEESKRVQDERDQTNKKINEKQIRSMRRSYRAPGFMDEESGSTTDTLG